MTKMTRFKGPLLFALCLMPIAAGAGFFLGRYLLDTMSEETLNQALAQFGSISMMILVTMIQSAIYALIFGFFGYLLADRIGLWRSVRPEKRPLAVTLIVSVPGGVLLSGDYWTFGKVIDGIRETDAAGLTMHGVIGSVLYGGIIEELMLRLFFMSLIALVLWRLFFRRRDREHIPTGVFVAANIVAALAFAAAHIPATMGMYESLTPLILVRCFLLNGAFALLFGRLYRQYGIIYAMMSHALLHVVSKLIWFIFI